MFVLDGWADDASAREFSVNWEYAPMLAPLACTFHKGGARRRAVQLLRLLSRVRCFTLRVGPPDETIHTIEQLVRHE